MVNMDLNWDNSMGYSDAEYQVWLEYQQKRKLKPPKNLRYQIPKSCGSCKDGILDTGGLVCARQPDTYLIDASEMYCYVCDYWKSHETSED